MKINGESRVEDPEHLTRMVQEYYEADEKSKTAKTNKRRWTDWLEENSLLRQEPDFVVGINVCRAGIVGLSDREIRNKGSDDKDPLNKDPDDFWEKVDAFREVGERFEKGEIELGNRQNISQWRHDLRNVLAVLVSSVDFIKKPYPTPTIK